VLAPTKLRHPDWTRVQLPKDSQQRLPFALPHYFSGVLDIFRSR